MTSKVGSYSGKMLQGLARCKMYCLATMHSVTDRQTDDSTMPTKFRQTKLGVECESWTVDAEADRVNCPHFELIRNRQTDRQTDR